MVNKYIIWGWVTTLFLPVLGFGFGVYNATHDEVGHGVAQIVLSVLTFSVWAGFLLAFTGV